MALIRWNSSPGHFLQLREKLYSACVTVPFLFRYLPMMAVFLYNWTFWEDLTVMLLPLLSSDNVIRSQCKCCWQLFYLVSLVLKDSFTCNQLWIFGMASLVCKEVNPDFPLELQLHPLRWYSEESICILSIINQLLSSLLAFRLRKSHCLDRTGSEFPSSFFSGSGWCFIREPD